MSASDKPNRTNRFSPMAMLRWLTGYNGLPYLARSTFRYEQASLIAASLGSAVAMGGFCQVFAKKGLAVPDWTLSALVAAPPAGSLVAALLTGVMRRWRQPAVASACMFIAAAFTAAIAALPLSAGSALPFAVLAIGATAMAMTSIQARTAIWQANYPDHMRGAILSRNFIMQTILAAILIQSLGAALDWRPELYRWMYLGGGVSFALAGVYMRKIRVRGEALRLKRALRRRPSLNPLGIVGVFRHDRRFTLYMAFQMVMGSATLAVGPVLPKILEETFGASYTMANFAMAAPLVAQVCTIPLLGGYFDRVSIFRFRAYGAGLWGVSRMCLAAAAFFVAMPMVVVSAVIMGVAQSFGRLAWSIGHMEFAKPEDTHLYMGAHMMLTGLRGLTMPFLGVWLYGRVLGVHLIWICAVLQLLTAVGYWLTDRPKKPAIVPSGPAGPYVP